MKVSLSFKVDPRIKQTLEKLAQQENRSVANYVVTLLLKHFKEKGIDWQKEDKEKPNK
jgi:predicted transcriptional regulator